MRSVRAKNRRGRKTAARRRRSNPSGWVEALRRRVWSDARLRFAILFAALAVVSTLGGFVLVANGTTARLSVWADASLRSALANAGLAVEQVTVKGRAQTTRAELIDALRVETGHSILHVSINDMRERIEDLPWVAGAAVERLLPSTIHISISERTPIAIWQHDNRLVLIDGDGVPITERDVPRYEHLPLVVGEGAPAAAGELLEILAAEPLFSSRVKAAVRVGQRRWNLRLFNGVDVQLPEAGAPRALRTLAALERDHRILGRAIEAIDLRQPDRVTVRLVDGAVARLRSPGTDT